MTYRSTPFPLMTSGATLLDCSSQIQSLDSLGRLICCWEWRSLLRWCFRAGGWDPLPSTLSLVGFWLGAPNLALLLRLLSLITLHFSLEMISSVDFGKSRRTGPYGHLTQEEKLVLDQFKNCHTRLENGRFMVLLPKKSGTKPLGESRSQAVRRFVAFERSLHQKSQFPEFKAVIDEYFESGHAEAADLNKPPHSVFYLPMHVVRKSSSTTTKVRAVFDASAKTSSGVSLNDTLLVGPTVHSSLVDVLLRFRQHRVALVADVSRMYRAIALTDADKDLHRFVWRSSPSDSIKDYRMTRVTFGVSASSFVSNMCVKQNALDLLGVSSGCESC